MKKILFYLIINLFFGISVNAFSLREGSIADTIKDGPYIFKVNNKFLAKWVEKGSLKTDYIDQKNFSVMKGKFNLLFDFNDIQNTFSTKVDYVQRYEGIDSICVISDIHGEYNTYINLLKSQGIIDNNLHWSFGNGHLVILGDVFDRGNMVTEVLWHLFGLEKEAIVSGGRVHFVIGNHEVMVLGEDLRYISEKYKKVDSVLGAKYYDLYSATSVLGNWLRNKPVAITINEIIFIHGGISIEMVRQKMEIERINRSYSKMITGKEIKSYNEIQDFLLINGDNSPVWYRGYFEESEFCSGIIDSLLIFYSKKHIIVGHTSVERIMPLFGNKVIGVDAGISKGNQGSMLIYKNGVFYEGTINGRRKL